MVQYFAGSHAVYRTFVRGPGTRLKPAPPLAVPGTATSRRDIQTSRIPASKGETLTRENSLPASWDFPEISTSEIKRS